MRKIIGLLLVISGNIFAATEGYKGYYRFPSLHGEQLVFTAEGDLWSVAKNGGLASRLTSNHGEETRAALSPDGLWIAFTAEYEGPKEVYLMPSKGGAPKRLTFLGSTALVRGWTTDGQIIFASNANHSSGRQLQLYLLNPQTRISSIVPLAQASDGAYSTPEELFFVRQTGRADYTRAYQGGTAQNIWLYKEGKEAIPVTGNYSGTSKNPMFWQERLYFVSDRSDNRIFNLWSVDKEGNNPEQHTFETRFDLFSPSLYQGEVVYQSGADLVLHNLNTGETRPLDIQLKSDFEQRRPYRLHYPMDYLSSFDISDNAQRLALVARGKLTTLPANKGRIIPVKPAKKKLIYNMVRYLPDSLDMIAAGDKGKYQSIWHIPAKPDSRPKRLYKTKAAIEYGPVISPDGQWLAWSDSEQALYLTNSQSGKTRKLFQGEHGDYIPQDLTWSPDSQWLVFVNEAENLNQQLHIANIDTGEIQAITSDRVNSYHPSWSASGQWLVFISDRYYESQVSHPFTHNQQEPFSVNNAGIFALAISKEARWPYTEANELDVEPSEQSETESSEETTLKVELDGLEKRLYRFPLPAGQYHFTALGNNLLYWLEPSESGFWNLKGLPLHSQKAEPYTVLDDIVFYRVSRSREALKVFKDNQLYYVPAGFRNDDLSEFLIDTSHWQLDIDPVQEWQHILGQAWKYYNNYFYDRGLNQVDWNARLAQFKPLVKRVADRSELNDILHQMVSIVGIMHLQLGGGDIRRNNAWIESGKLGAKLEQKPEGYQVQYIYQNDPDYPEERSPLSHPSVEIQVGDIITSINNQPLSQSSPDQLLLNQKGQQVLVEYMRPGEKTPRKTIVYPIDSDERQELIYRDSLETKRERTEQLGQGKIGYVHLTALKSGNFSQWIRQYYPIFQKEGLVLDLRNNTGGNIDSWILSRLMRKVVYFESQRNQTTKMWGMPYAFRGHIVALINEHTMSDAEVLADSLRELRLAPLIGTRTWGGRVWRIRMSLLDHGALSVPIKAHFNERQQWASENYGIEPDIEIDNLPHETFLGKDAQLDTAIRHLLDKIEKQPVSLPDPPARPVIPVKNQP